MKIKSEVTVLHVSRYSFEKEGKEIKGAKVTYCEDMECNVTDNQIGVTIQQANIPYNLYEDFNIVPAIYDVDFVSAVKGGQPILKPIKFTFVSGL